jgi:hypothetical protein
LELIFELRKNFLDIYKLRRGKIALSEGKHVMFHALGPAALAVLSDLAEKRVAARDRRLVVTDRRIDESLLTERLEQNWSVRLQGEENWRQAYLLERARRQGRSPGRKRLS